MGALRLVPSDGLPADRASSSSKSDKSSSTDSSSWASEETPRETQKQEQGFHQSWIGTQRQEDTPEPFIATVEPMDKCSEKRERNILCQKVLMLAAQLFPDTACSSDLQVEYVGAGSFHDVIGFTVPTLKLITSDSDSSRSEGRFVVVEDKYVVRIPHADNFDHGGTNTRRDIAILRGLEGKFDADIPRIVAWDLGTANVLDAPYTLETRLRGRSLHELVRGECALLAHNISSFKQVIRLVEGLAQITARYAGDIAETFGEGIDWRLCASRVPMKRFQFPFDAASLTQGTYGKDGTPLAFMLKLVDLWIKYDTEHWPDQETFAVWSQVKGILRSLERRGFLGDAFHLSHGDLASRNVMAEIVDDATIEVTGVVDWDFACFAPKFCAYRPPLDMWSGAEDVAVKECSKELIEIFKETTSAEYVHYALSKEAKLGRKLWLTLLQGVVEDRHQSWALDVIWEWNRLYPDDKICGSHSIY
ncbi:hypothetical protein E8E11_003211 [Didymella keratinophila]|nr:hypothetical protein E8E11_003211 [Didymella keratinophila]